ncbi:hypothetical protein C0Q70_13786 [Pomacea canaliculata]|uniref:MoeA C-terminal domain-containing protein n=1 Tax=Pomacea canaliculata TaxID=400727 RepID=A0A2T7NY62_POMCA|nr:hypothetical protein C0Q70_13786 [Pomacea canaliculata]
MPVTSVTRVQREAAADGQRAKFAAQKIKLPAIRRMMGCSTPELPVIRVKLDRAVRLDPRPEYHRAVASWLKGDDVATASSTGNQISSRLLSVKEANVLLRLPPKSTSHCHPGGGGGRRHCHREILNSFFKCGTSSANNGQPHVMRTGQVYPCHLHHVIVPVTSRLFFCSCPHRYIASQSSTHPPNRLSVVLDLSFTDFGLVSRILVQEVANSLLWVKDLSTSGRLSEKNESRRAKWNRDRFLGRTV